MNILNKLLKKVGVAIGTTAIVLGATSLVYAASGTYNSTYSMTGGVYSQVWNASAKPTFTVSLYPDIGVANANITIYLERDNWNGWGVVTSKSVSSTSGSTSTLYGQESGEHRIYLRNYSGKLMQGDVTIKYSW